MDEQLLAQRSGLFRKVKDLLVDPCTEWQRIAAREQSIGGLLLCYAAPLAAIGPLADLIGSQLLGYGAVRPNLALATTAAVTIYALELGSLFALAGLAHLLAPLFGGRSTYATSFRLVTYSMTAAWVAGIFGLVPVISFFELLGLYSIYLYFTGSREMLKIPNENAPVFTAASFALALAVFVGASILASSVRL